MAGLFTEGRAAMSVRRYETVTVECSTCSGDGEIFLDPPDVYARCEQCFGTGVVEVCANCYDGEDDCTICAPLQRQSAPKGATSGLAVPPCSPASGDQPMDAVSAESNGDPA